MDDQPKTSNPHEEIWDRLSRRDQLRRDRKRINEELDELERHAPAWVVWLRDRGILALLALPAIMLIALAAGLAMILLWPFVYLERLAGNEKDEK